MVVGQAVWTTVVEAEGTAEAMGQVAWTTAVEAEGIVEATGEAMVVGQAVRTTAVEADSEGTWTMGVAMAVGQVAILHRIERNRSVKDWNHNSWLGLAEYTIGIRKIRL